MEYVDGMDALRAVTGSGAGVDPMPEGIALHIAAEIAHALAYIHDLRDEDDRPLAIVHRDVSPPNILLSWNGDVKLSDFGIALASEQPAALGGVQGKLHYMAPEQARGEPVGAAADVYALGATLDALLGGGALSPVSSDESGNAREAAAQQRGLSLPVCALIHSCMTRDPGFARPPPTSRRARVCSRRGCWAPTAAARCARGWSRCGRGCGRPGRWTISWGCVWFRWSARARGPSRSAASGRLRQDARGRAPPGPIAALADRSGGCAGDRCDRCGARAGHRPRAEPQRGCSGPKAATVLVAGQRGDSAPAFVHPAAIAANDVQQTAQHTADHDTVKRGWLRVGGAALVGARVDADGAFAGFAPLELTLPDGPHAIVVTSVSGRVLVRKHLRISEQHTRLAPLRIIH